MAISKDRIMTEINKKNNAENAIVENNWLVNCLTHPSNKVNLAGQAIARDLISPKCRNLLYIN